MMNEESYIFRKEPQIFYYEFSSEGPNGIIKKVVQFQQIAANEEIYNLGFGDFNEDLDEIDDLSVSNNNDTHKVLATVAKTVIDFMQNHPNSIVMAKGSTPSRTRLYIKEYSMAALNEKEIPFNKLSSQERQAKYNASPYFRKKNEEAAEFLKKHPIPKEFIKR